MTSVTPPPDADPDRQEPRPGPDLDESNAQSGMLGLPGFPRVPMFRDGPLRDSRARRYWGG